MTASHRGDHFTRNEGSLSSWQNTIVVEKLNQDLSFGIGTAVSILFAFLRYRFPTMGKHTAEAGIAAGILLIIADIMVPDMRPALPAAAMFLIGCLCIGASIDLWINQNKTGDKIPSPINSNNLSNVNNNRGIVTQSQNGDNTLSK
jgi:xanthosine utilization system XapX-like protein